MSAKCYESRKTLRFPMICGSGLGSKSTLSKAAGACRQIRNEQLHAAVARSTCPSQNLRKSRSSVHFWKLSVSRMERRCGAKHVSKSKC